MGNQQRDKLPRPKANPHPKAKPPLPYDSPPLPIAENGSRSDSGIFTYVGAAIICFILASIIFIIAKPEEKTGPPQPQAPTQEGMPEGAAGLPSGHPDTSASQAQVIEQLKARVATLEQSLKEQPDNVMIHLDIANALYDMGEVTGDSTRFIDAVAHYRKFLAATPEDPDARTDLAYGLYRTGNVDGAITELYKVLAAHPKHQHAAFNLGLMYKEKDQPDSVLAYMKLTASVDSTTEAGQAAAEILRAYQTAH